MKKAQWMALLLAALLALPGCALAGDVWTVNVSHDLEGGSWLDDRQILPYQLVAPVGKSMDPNSLHMEKMVQPFMAESVFMGWSVLFTDAYNGELVYDGSIIDWLQDNEDVEYAAYFDNDWVMLYSPKWVDGGGIGFMSWDHVSLPGVDVD